MWSSTFIKLSIDQVQFPILDYDCGQLNREIESTEGDNYEPKSSVFCPLAQSNCNPNPSPNPSLQL